MIRLLPLVVALALAACAPAGAPSGTDVDLGARVERVRGHLIAARGNAAAGRWDLAHVHAVHPAEDLPGIDRVLRAKDAGAASSLAARLAVLPAVSYSRDAAATAAALDEAESALAGAAAAALGTEATRALAYRASLVAALAEASAAEYDESFADGRIAVVVEYQDAHAFLARARATWAEIAPDVARAAPASGEEVGAALDALASLVPSLDPPRAPAPPAQVRALAASVRSRLGAVGARAPEAAATDLASAAKHLDTAVAALDLGDVPTATGSVAAFSAAWLDVEGSVLARSPDAYAAIERDMTRAAGHLGRRPAEVPEARAALDRMRSTLAPFVASPATYGVLDAALILLREGLEALLVVGAVLAFLRRTGNGDKARWIWGGAGAGVALSVVVAVVLTVAFSSATAGMDRELLEGVTGLAAAVLLVYVSWWLHSRSSLAAWDRHVRERTSAALARNSVASLALVSFLAVFREGAETVIFYIGIAPGIAPTDLALGLALAVAALGALGVAMLAFSVRLPLRPFFLVASGVVYYLSFKFVGTGVHALQIAGAIPSTPAPIPESAILGTFATLETTVPQLLLLTAAAAVLLRTVARAAPARAGTIS